MAQTVLHVAPTLLHVARTVFCVAQTVLYVAQTVLHVRDYRVHELVGVEGDQPVSDRLHCRLILRVAFMV